MTNENYIKSQFYPNDDQLELIATLTIGDGCIAKGGRLVIAHGKNQKDYCEWKAKKLSNFFNQKISANETRQCFQLQFQRKFLKEFRYKWYPDDKKRISSILHFIKNPLETIAVWICDDGNISPSINSNNGKCYSAAIQIFTFTDIEESILLANWFEKSIGIRPNLLYRDRSKQNKKSAYILKFKASDSRKIYNLIKDYIPNIESMKYKFRYLENNLPTRPQKEINP